MSTISEICRALKVRVPKQFPAFWSYTRWGNYKQCPTVYFHAAVLKIKIPKNKAMERGTDIHKKAEHFLKGNIRGIPDELRKFATEFRGLKRVGANPEAAVAVRDDWSQTHVKDWAGVWLRVVADADVVENVVATTIDFKTGRQYPGHKDQGHLLATAKMAVYPHVEQVDVEFWYLDSGEVVPWSYKRKDFARMRRAWESRATKMLTDRTFKPTPGKHCDRCQYRDDRLGGCKAWRKIRKKQ